MYLGLDLGTTNIKAVIADARGQILSSSSAPVQLFTLENGRVEQDIDDIWAASLAAISQLDTKRRNAVRAIGVSSQGGAMQVLDQRDRPLGRVISWLDIRGQPFDQQITQKLGPELPRRSGHARSIMALGQLLRLKSESPTLIQPPHHIGFVGDIIVGRLCGRRAHDGTSLSCAILYNPQTKTADPLMLDCAGIGREQLPDLLSVNQPAGTLQPEISHRLGLPEDIRVSPALHDQYASALSLAATEPGDIMLGTGTAWVMLAVSNQLMQPLAGVGFVCTHLVDGMFGQIVSLVNGGSATTWATRLFNISDVDEALNSVPPGCDGVSCSPSFAQGTATFHGLGLAHGPAHMLRAVIEGLCFELARHLKLFAGAGVHAKRLVLCGGAASSRVTPQIIADVTNLPVACANESATSALGAAVIARGLTEPSRPLSQLAKEMHPDFRMITPGLNSKIYRSMAESL